MELTTDVDRAAWLIERAGAWARVGGVVGTGWPAYARILHPVAATLFDHSRTDEWGMPGVLREESWRWSRVAERLGRTMHPLVQWNRLTEDVHDGIWFDDGWHVGQSDEGYLDTRLLASLTEHLAGATTTPDDLVAGIWSGWGELNPGSTAVCVSLGGGLRGRAAGWWAKRRAVAEVRDALSLEVAGAARRGPWVEWPGRELVPFVTLLAELADPTWPERAGIGGTAGTGDSISPQLIWPEDHAWVVGTEIDWDSTIVAGPRSLVDAVLADETFEAFEVGEDADLSYEGDTINPPRDA